MSASEVRNIAKQFLERHAAGALRVFLEGLRPAGEEQQAAEARRSAFGRQLVAHLAVALR